MRFGLHNWLKFFRVVNLPTVPGDVLVGAAAATWCVRASLSAQELASVALAVAASCCIYMFGLADNDIVGAATDKDRPIPDGEISPGAAKAARAVCLVAGLVAVAAVGALPLPSGIALPTAASALHVFAALVIAIVAYNRTKRPLLMGLCRGLNVFMGVAIVAPPLFLPRILDRAPMRLCVVAAVIAIWTLYIAAVTKYSEGEEDDPERKRRVGALIGGIVYLQLVALIAFALVCHANNPLLVTGAVLLVALRIVKTLLPKVGAS